MLQVLKHTNKKVDREGALQKAKWCPKQVARLLHRCVTLAVSFPLQDATYPPVKWMTRATSQDAGVNRNNAVQGPVSGLMFNKWGLPLVVIVIWFLLLVGQERCLPAQHPLTLLE